MTFPTPTMPSLSRIIPQDLQTMKSPCLVAEALRHEAIVLFLPLLRTLTRSEGGSHGKEKEETSLVLVIDGTYVL